MREKYVEERFPRYFVFGVHRDGRVDVASTHCDTLATVLPDEANRLIADRDAVIDMLVKLADLADVSDKKKFAALWYRE